LYFLGTKIQNNPSTLAYFTYLAMHFNDTQGIMELYRQFWNT